MCTLTYLPTGKNSFFWTQNRDESPFRTSPGLVYSDKSDYLYPKEPLSGGTWISMAKDNRIVSLLNGAFLQTKYIPSTKKSRGIVVLDFMNYPSATQFFEEYNFEDVESFTMVIYDKGELWDFRWDKVQKHIKKMDLTQPHIWSSSTLYPASVKTLRKEWFRGYLSNTKEHTRDSILDFHKTGGTGDIQNDLIMDRGMVKTVSVTSISKKENSLDMIYYDLVNEGNTREEFLLK